jgi:TPR repeat protein
VFRTIAYGSSKTLRTLAASCFLSLAVELEYPKAIYSLGCLYEFGMGVPTDKERAYAMYERAYSLLFRDPRSKFKLSILKRAKAKL